MESFVAVRFWFCEILKTHFRITYIIKTNPYNFRISELRKLGLGKEGLQNLTGNQEKLLEEVLSRSAQMWWREVVVSAGGGGARTPRAYSRLPLLVQHSAVRPSTNLEICESPHVTRTFGH